jgi:hypothetical protein
MAMIIRLLGAGAITTAATTPLYSAPGTVLGAIVDNVRVVNLAGSSVTVNLNYTPSGSSSPVRILDWNKSIAANDLVVVKPELTMAPGDKVELVTTGSPNIEYVVCGTEKI